MQSNLTLSESGDEFTGRSKWDLLDANWTVVFRGTSDLTATRLETPEQGLRRRSVTVCRGSTSPPEREVLRCEHSAFPTFAYLSSATKARRQSFCSPHISAASRVISAGSKAGCVTTAVRKPVQIEIPQKGRALGVSFDTMQVQDESMEMRDPAHRLLPTPFSSAT